MTIEIRELIIEARVLPDEHGAGSKSPRPQTSSLDSHVQARLVEQVVRRVLRILEDRRERLQ
ncbi:hypothetical protein ACVWZP_001085 [Pseudomonas sp. TE36184]|jgi:hypothetical protein